MKIPGSYSLVKQTCLEELRTEVYLLRHDRSGARVFLIPNDDENKVFYIGFRTPVSDSTGVPHIMEHSVLCGSEKFPVRDPFMEMEKGSLQTFLNAFTYPDKTVYPVASCNDKDFANLMDVYLDAVLHPNIYRTDKTFRQEGWHYELESPEGELTINGVVYNEMKGAFSVPDDVMERYILNSLFPHSGYAYESGGDPAVIPELTYEQFLNFHRTYYHPSNSYIYLYGNADMTERLEFLDREYLCKYDRITVDSQVLPEAPFAEPVCREVSYAIDGDEDPAGRTWFSKQWVMGDILDPELYLAGQVLDYALVGAEGAPLKQALLDRELGEDVLGGYRSDCRQPYFTVMLRNADREREQEFIDTVEETLRRAAEEGIDKKALLAAINNLEFRMREADYGYMPKGLIYGMCCLESWLYDDNAPELLLRYEAIFEKLKARAETGYFEELIRKYLLDNPHSSLVILNPECGLAESREAALRESLSRMKAGLTEEALQTMVRETAELKAWQEAGDSPEDLAKVPGLSLSDVKENVTAFSTRDRELAGIRVLTHETFTGGITYLSCFYDISGLCPADISTAGLLQIILGAVDTEERSYADLSHEEHILTGGMGTKITLIESPAGDITPYFIFSVKFLHDRLEQVEALMAEVRERSLFDSEKRLQELILQIRARMQSQMLDSSHTVAVSRALSYFSAADKYQETVSGMDFYRYISGLAENFDSRKEELIDDLYRVTAKIFSSPLMLDITDDEESCRRTEAYLTEKLTPGIPAEKAWGGIFTGQRENEGLKTSGQVNFDALAGEFRSAGLEYTGVLQVMRRIMSTDYLWIRLRVKGGAYGCMCSFGRSGRGYFVSYRDPHLKETYDVYSEIADYLRNLELDEEALKAYIIGTIGTLDRPMTPSGWGSACCINYLSGVTDDMRRLTRKQVLGCTLEDLRGTARYVEAVAACGNLCVVGTASDIEANRDMFGTVKNLF